MLLTSGTPGLDTDTFFHGTAPELVGGGQFGLTETGATKATDIYAFGVLAWEASAQLMVSCRLAIKQETPPQVFAVQVPFSDKTKVAGVLSMWKGHRPARPHHPELSENLWRVIEACWRVNPARRITIREVVLVLETEAAAAYRSKSGTPRQDRT